MPQKKLSFVFLLSILLSSCSLFESDSKDKYSYEFIKNSKLEVSYFEGSYLKYSSLIDGENMVFSYDFVAAQDDDIADDEYGESIRFQIESNIDSFKLEGEDLVNSNVVLTKSCFCYFEYEEAKDVAPFGSIEGEKISENLWNIKLDVTFYGDEKRVFNENFLLKSN